MMVKRHLVEIWLCELCLSGKGGECHTPGCALWLNRSPDLPIGEALYTVKMSSDDSSAAKREQAHE